jgi:hypothetical protein
LNAKKDVAVRHVGKHAFEIDQMLAKNGNGTTDFKNGHEDGWPAKRNKESKSGIDGQEKTSAHKTNTYHAMGKVINNDINCIKLNPMDLAPSDSSKRPPSDNVI